MDLPNFELIRTSFQTAINECSKISNIPIMHQAQQTGQILDKLTVLQQNLEQFRTEFRTEIEGVRTEIDQLKTELRDEMADLRHDENAGVLQIKNLIQVESHNNQARLFNGLLSQDDLPLTPLVDERNKVPLDFPENIQAISALTEMTIYGLLNAYKLRSFDLTLEEKQRKFAQYIGARKAL